MWVPFLLERKRTMATIHEYTAQINGCDVEEDYRGEMCWSDEHYTIEEIPLLDETHAIAFLKGISPSQAVAWENKSKCNSVEVIVYMDEVHLDEDGSGHYDDFRIFGSAEWIGNQLNGIWIGNERID